MVALSSIFLSVLVASAAAIDYTSPPAAAASSPAPTPAPPRPVAIVSRSASRPAPQASSRSASSSAASASASARPQFLCPPGVVGTYVSDATSEFGLRFCSNTQRWSPAVLFSSRPITLARQDYAEAARQCSVTCLTNCAAFSVAPATLGNVTFNCNLYNASLIFTGPTTGGLFYARQPVPANRTVVSSSSFVCPSPARITVTVTATVCPAPAPVVKAAVPTMQTVAPMSTPAPRAASQSSIRSSIRAAMATPITFPIVFSSKGVSTMVTASNQVVTVTRTRTVTVTSVVAPGATLVHPTTTIVNRAAVPTTVTVRNVIAVQSIAPYNVFLLGNGPVQVIQIINKITINVIIINIVNYKPVERITTTTIVRNATAMATPSPSAVPRPAFVCPAYVVQTYPDAKSPTSRFVLRFCSNVYRWNPAYLFSSTPIPNSSYEVAAKQCAASCLFPRCTAYSVAPSTPGGTTLVVTYTTRQKSSLVLRMEDCFTRENSLRCDT